MLREKLIERQRRLGLNDVEFARRLGVPRPTWALTRLGHKPVRRRIALAAMKAFPDLTPDCVSFLLSDVTSVTDAVTTESVHA